MTDRLITSKISSHSTLQTLLRVASMAVVAVGLWANPSVAKDPFRTTNPRPISDRTESAFKALFEQGNFRQGVDYLQQGEANDPLVAALKAYVTYNAWEHESDAQKRTARLKEFRSQGIQTRQLAEQILASDPVRANIYIAVGHFFESAYAFSTMGTVKGAPKILGEIRQALDHLDAAEKIAPKDPELNLIKGYMDMFTALYLPFASPDAALERLNQLASPRYLADRGIALLYRDLNEPTKALSAIDRALEVTPNNPDLQYLKAQILVRQGNDRESIQWFDKALQKKDQLAPGAAEQIAGELKRAKERLGIPG